MGHANVPDDGVLDLLAGQHSRMLNPEQTASDSMPLEKAAQGERDSLCASHCCLAVSQSSLMPLLALEEAAGLVEGIRGSATGLPPRLLRLYPESLRGFPLPPFPHRQGDPATAGSCHGNIKRGCLCQASFTQATSPPRDECFKQTALPYARGTAQQHWGSPDRNMSQAGADA